LTKLSKFQAALLFGGPGSGKGTQGGVIAGFPNMRHLAMGDIFRSLDKQSDIGKEFLSYSTKGLLVPDELTVRVWKKHVEDRVLSNDIDRGYHILLLDGIPRTVRQVTLMSPLINVLQIIHFFVPNESVLVERLKGRALKGNRPDDADESVILERLKVYNEATAPVLRAYDASLIAEINADQPPFAVLRDVADCLAKRLPAAI